MDNLRFEAAPEWLIYEDRYCRACDTPTGYVLSAVQSGHTFPCCDNPTCREEVERQIQESIAHWQSRRRRQRHQARPLRRWLRYLKQLREWATN